MTSHYEQITTHYGSGKYFCYSNTHTCVCSKHTHTIRKLESEKKLKSDRNNNKKENKKKTDAF